MEKSDSFLNLYLGRLSRARGQGSTIPPPTCVGEKMATKMLPKKGRKALRHSTFKIRSLRMATSVDTNITFSGSVSVRPALFLYFSNFSDHVRGVIRL